MSERRKLVFGVNRKVLESNTRKWVRLKREQDILEWAKLVKEFDDGERR